MKWWGGDSIEQTEIWEIQCRVWTDRKGFVLSLCLKTSPPEKPLKPWEEFDLHMKMNLLGGNIFIWMVRTKTRFHTEANWVTWKWHGLPLTRKQFRQFPLGIFIREELVPLKYILQSRPDCCQVVFLLKFSKGLLGHTVLVSSFFLLGHHHTALTKRSRLSDA